MAIVSFNCTETQALFVTGQSRRFANFKDVAMRKLTQLDAAPTLLFLTMPPGNRLEKLSGDLSGQHGIRINGQWRVCFAWTQQGPAQVEIVDYH
ncbi:MAG: type II toxin-antitoxin system RelE/ParE family toxin [Desulfovibrionaceae bacterium]|jgi:proteic killer suppression protein|nr:type II toxin-antitoxin system RelE/ParE family toxin [Desulfovibrionaceae bacterium]